jgi:hypothetical protein
MLRYSGRAARLLAGQCGTMLHKLSELVLGLAVILAVATGLLAWRLAQGPLELGWLAQRIEAAITADLGADRVHIATAALAWEGFHRGVDLPLDVRLTGLTALDAAGTPVASIPRADLSFSVGALLLGRLVPRAIEIDGATLRVLRAADGAVSLDLGGAAGDARAPATPEANPFDRIFTELAQPAQTDLAPSLRGSWLNQMGRLLIRDARLTVVDRQLGATWQAPSARIDLRRRPGGGVSGDLDIALALGTTTTRLTATASLEAGGAATHVQAHLGPVTPAALAGAAAALAPLAAVAAPVSADATLELGPALAIRAATLAAHVAAGTVHVATAAIALRGAELRLTADPQGVSVTTLRLVLPPQTARAGADTVLTAAGRVRRGDGHLLGALSLDIDQLAAADLAALWPEGMAHGARAWVVPNITAGTARNGHLEAAMTIAPDLSDVTLTGLSGSVAADDVTVWWLRPIPPVVHCQGSLTLDGPDAMTITMQGGRQTGTPGTLLLHDGTMHISGLQAHQQIGAITVHLTGPVTDAVAVLHQPRLHLFDQRKLDLRDPSGSAAAQLSVTLPLTDKATLDQIRIAAHAHLADVHLSGIVAGRDIDRGQFDLDVDNDGLHVAGPAAVAGIPASLKAMLDFRDGPASQVVESATLTGTADDTQLRRAGLDSAGILVGPVALGADYAQRRDGTASLDARADMAAASVGVTPLGWRKPAGSAATASARLLLDHDRIVGVDHLRADGQGLLVRGTADYADGRPGLLKLDQLVLGETSAHGQVAFPATAGAPIRLTLAGPKLDLSARLDAPAKPHPHVPDPADGGGPAYVAELRFEQALLAEQRPLGRLTASVASDGHVITSARVEATGAQHVLAEIVPGAEGRRFLLSAGDGGALLRTLALTRAVAGGRLSVTGRFDDRQKTRPLEGVVRLEEFRINNAPVMGKVLQGMTLYGLVDALQGPGLSFAQLVAPFRLDDDRLELSEARAFSPSLGMTAQGRLDLAEQTIDLRGTIVPAYFFNTLLGNVPLVGRLFSPEKDGGVFSATYAVHGALDDPEVVVNPLAALTPGFLRGVFGIFDR